MKRVPKQDDVLTLLRMLRSEQDREVAALMEEDLRWSVRTMQPRLRAQALMALAATNAYRLNPEDEDTQAVFAEIDSMLSGGGPREVDVAIVTVKEPELDAVKATFNIPLTQRGDHYAKGAYFFESEVTHVASGAPLKIVITKVGEAGNDTMAAFLSTVFSAYSARLCCLVGMAAGNDQEAALGDVVFGREIVDFKRKIVTALGEDLDPRPLSPGSELIRDVSFLRPEFLKWHALVREVISRTTSDHEGINLPPNFDPAAFRPKFLLKRLLAADELIEDDSIPRRAAVAGPPRRTAGAEMEGAGFAIGCEEWGTQWLVMRGIADFGRKEGADRPKTWQFVSTVAAAMCLRLWLEHGNFMSRKLP
jgi:nucleoside phosphorylase